MFLLCGYFYSLVCLRLLIITIIIIIKIAMNYSGATWPEAVLSAPLASCLPAGVEIHVSMSPLCGWGIEAERDVSLAPCRAAGGGWPRAGAQAALTVRHVLCCSAIQPPTGWFPEHRWVHQSQTSAVSAWRGLKRRDVSETMGQRGRDWNRTLPQLI